MDNLLTIIYYTQYNFLLEAKPRLCFLLMVYRMYFYRIDVSRFCGKSVRKLKSPIFSLCITYYILVVDILRKLRLLLYFYNDL